MEDRFTRILKFLKFLRLKCREHASKYDEFLRLMRGFKEQRYFLLRIDYAQAHRALQELFSSQPRVIHELNRVLPPLHRMSSISSFEQAPEFTDSDSSIEIEEPSPSKVPKISLAAAKLCIPELSDPLLRNEVAFYRRLSTVFSKNSLPSTCYFSELCLSIELFLECVISKTELFLLVSPLFQVTDS